MSETDKSLEKAVEYLQESEATYRGLFESLDQAIQICELVFDDNGQPVDNIILDVNPAYEKHSGLKKEEVVGKHIKSILSVVEQVWLDRYAEVVREGKSMHFEEYNAGLGRWFDVHASPLGKNRFAAIFTDITKNKKSEGVLIENEKRFRSFFELPLIGIAITSPDKSWIEVNDKLSEILGYSREELFNTTWDKITHPDDIDKDVEQFNKVLDGYIDSYNLEKRFIRKDGSVIDSNISIGCIRNDDKSVNYFVALIEDISERKIAEEEINNLNVELSNHVNELQTILDIAPTIIMIAHDPECKNITGNAYVDQIIMQVPRRGNISQSAQPDEADVSFDVFCDGVELKPEELPAQVAASTGKLVPETEFELVFPNGRIVNVILGAMPLFDEEGNVRGSIVAGSDITERKKAHANLELIVQKRTEELSIERNRLFDVLETLPVMICLISPEYYITFANRAFREMFGESEGRHCYEYCFGYNEPCKFCESLKPLETGKPHNWIVNAPDGSIIDAYDFPFIDSDGKTLILEMDIDITEQRKTIEELKRSNEELEQFAYISSHDLQEPLRTIASFTQLLQRRYKGKFDGDADEFMEYTVEAAVRMKEQIEGLLEYSRVATKGEEFKQVDMNSTLNQAVGILSMAINESNAKITYDKLPWVIGDANQLHRVFQNLISNAIRFRKCEEPLKIHMSSYRIDDNEFIFSIKDNGIGIEKQYHERIFTIFQRLHTRDVYKGTGIGLSVVKRIIERHGGRVWVESEFGLGSVFYFTIPIRKS